MQAKYENGIVTIIIPYDPNNEYPKSSTKKSRIISSSSGFTDVENAPELKLSMNLITIIPKSER